MTGRSAIKLEIQILHKVQDYQSGSSKKKDYQSGTKLNQQF